MTAETWRQYTHADDLVVAERAIARHLSGELDYYDVEFRQRHKQGHWV